MCRSRRTFSAKAGAAARRVTVPEYAEHPRRIEVTPFSEIDDPRLASFKLAIRRHLRQMTHDGFFPHYVLTRPEGDIRPPHVHEYDAHVHVLKGTLTIQMTAGPVTLQENESCLVPAGERHAEATGPEGVILLVGCR